MPGEAEAYSLRPEARVRLVKQVGCVYEVQAFCHEHQWPTGLVKKLFYNLYETDIIFEDAYGVWREDVSDATPGKDKALFQARAAAGHSHRHIAHMLVYGAWLLSVVLDVDSCVCLSVRLCVPSQVNEFLQWLDEAVEEDGEGEEGY